MKAKKKHEENHLEADIVDSFEKGEWKSVPNLKEEIGRIAASATSSLAKDKRINIRISSHDLEGLQMKAAEEGLPYQTLISSILHKYVSGRLVDSSLNQKPKTSQRVKNLHPKEA